MRLNNEGSVRDLTFQSLSLSIAHKASETLLFLRSYQHTPQEKKKVVSFFFFLSVIATTSSPTTFKHRNVLNFLFVINYVRWTHLN